MAGGRFFLELQKHEKPKRFCVAEEKGKGYHLLFKWNEVRQMVEEGP